MSADESVAIWIGNLNHKANEGHLGELLKAYELHIISIHVKRDSATKESKGFAFVNVRGRFNALGIVRTFNGRQHMGAKLKFNIKEEKQRATSESSRSNPALGRQTRPASASSFGLASAGSPRSASVFPPTLLRPLPLSSDLSFGRDSPRSTPFSRGQQPSPVQSAPQSAYSRPQSVPRQSPTLATSPASRADHHPDPHKPATLWIGSLHPHTKEEEIRQLFSAYRGSITSVRIMRDEKDKKISRGFGFINFTNGRHAKDAFDNLQGERIHGVKIVLSIKKEGKDEDSVTLDVGVGQPLPAHPQVIRVIEKVSVLFFVPLGFYKVFITR